MRRHWDGLGEAGQVMVGVMLLLALLAVMVPLMVFYTQRESKWVAKQDQSTSAFHLAEVGIEKGYRALSRSTGTWYALIDNGTPIDLFKYDHAFDDITGGWYAVSITSGPEARQATVISAGKDQRGKEVRAIRAVFTQNILDDVAIQAMEGMNVLGGVNVEWGAIVAQDHVDTGGRSYPQFHSATSLSVDTNPDAPNCDAACCQWFSFSEDVPPDPGIDLNLYRSSAAGGSCSIPGSTGDAPPGSCYFAGDQNWDTSVPYSGGGTIFVEGDLNVKTAVNIIGNLVVTGDFSTQSGGWGSGSVDMDVPQSAWRQYCNPTAWTHYIDDFDPTGPGVFPGLDATYESANTLTYTTTPGGKTAIQGFMYIGGNLSTGGGGGNTVIYGALFSVGTVTIAANSGVTVYYSKAAAENVKTTRLILNRKSWKAEVMDWPGP